MKAPLQLIFSAFLGPKPLGLSISAIRKFVEDHPRVKTHHLTTSQVNSEFVKPETKDLYRSYLELYHGSIDDATGSPLVVDATVFVSHAWKYAFYDIVVNVMEQRSNIPVLISGLTFSQITRTK